MELTGKVAVITGAASGIGRATALALAAECSALALLDRQGDALEGAVAEARAAGAKTIGIETDVSREDRVEAAARRIADELGGVHILVNSAGVVLRGLPVAEIPTEKWNWILGINLYGPIHTVRAFLPAIRAHGEGGHIVNVASISGFFANDRGTGAYQTSKFGVVGFSEVLAVELAGEGIGVSIVAPAGVNTTIYENSAAQRSDLAGAGAMVTAPPDLKAGKDPAEIAAHILDGIRDGRLYIMTHAETKGWIEPRMEAILAAYTA